MNNTIIYFSSFIIVLSLIVVLYYFNLLRNPYLLTRIRNDYKKNLNLWAFAGAMYLIVLVLKFIEGNL